MVATAIVGYFVSRQVPPAPPQGEREPLDFHFVRTSIALVRNTSHDKRVFLAIMAISFFWTIGAVLFIQFPPLAKNVLTASKEVASLFLVIFSIGVAIGSISINALLKGTVSARYSPISVLAMGGFVLAFYFVCRAWTPEPVGTLLDVPSFIAHPMAVPLLVCLLGIAVAGRHVRGAALRVPHHVRAQDPDRADDRGEQHRQFRGDGARLAARDGAERDGRRIVDHLLLTAAMCLVSAWLGLTLLRAERAADPVRR